MRWLAEVFRSHETIAFFADRADFEIATGGRVTYRDVVSVIDPAAKGGVTDRLALDQKSPRLGLDRAGRAWT